MFRMRFGFALLVAASGGIVTAGAQTDSAFEVSDNGDPCAERMRS
jgi:hypothetical protein